MKLSPQEIGRAIRAARENAGWTQAKLAEGVRTTQQTIEKIESGKVKRSSYIHDIVELLGIDLRAEDLPASAETLRLLPIGEQVAAARKELGLTIAQVSELTAFSESDIQNVEDGGMQPDAAELARALLSALGSWSDTDKSQMPISPDELSGRSYAAFPSEKMTFPYYVTGQKKGMRLAFFAEHPLEVPRLLNVGGLIINGDWIRGGPVRGDRYYFKAMTGHHGSFLAKSGFCLIFKLNELPEDIEEIHLVYLVRVTGRTLVVAYPDETGVEEFELKRADWGILQVIGMYTVPRMKK